MSTKIWRLMHQFEAPFAEAGLRSPLEEIIPAECDRCSRGADYARPTPLVFEWEPGSDLIGDFTWPDGARVAVKGPVYEALAQRFRGIHAEPVEMVQDPKLKRPKRPTKRTKPRVWLPYVGPELVELWPERTVPFLPHTTLDIHLRCEDCGRELPNISGFEYKAHKWNPKLMDLVPDLQPRIPGQGLFVAATEIGDTPIFRVEEFTEMILCTDEVKTFIQEKGFTNVDFWEYGDVV